MIRTGHWFVWTWIMGLVKRMDRGDKKAAVDEVEVPHCNVGANRYSGKSRDQRMPPRVVTL